MWSRQAWMAIAAQLAAAASCAVAWYVLLRRAGIEGAYFNRVAVVSTSGPPAWVVDALHGAALTLLATAVATAVGTAWARRRVAVASATLGALAVVACAATIIRAFTTRDGGGVLDAIANAWIIDAARDTGPWIVRPDVLVGVTAGLALSAVSVAVAARQPRSQLSTSSAWRSGGNTG